MNNRYLVGILTCLAEVAVFGIILADLALNCVQSYFSFPLNDYWTELLIDSNFPVENRPQSLMR